MLGSDNKSNEATHEHLSILRRRTSSFENFSPPKPIKQRRITWADGEGGSQKENGCDANPEQNDTSPDKSTPVPWYNGYFGGSKPVHLKATNRRPSQSKN